MFWNKKDDRLGLPDLPPIKSPFSQELAPSQVVAENSQKEPEQNQLNNPPLPTFPDSPSDKGFSQTAIKEAVIDSPEEKVEPEPIIQNEFESSIIETRKEQTPQDTQETQIVYPNEQIDVNPYLSSITSSPKPSPKQVINEVPKPIISNARPSSKFVPEFIEDKQQDSNPYLSASLNPALQLPPVENKVPPIELPKSPLPIEKFDRIPIQKPFVQERTIPQPAQKSSEIFIKIDKFYSAKKTINSVKQQIEEIDELLRKIRETKMKEERELSAWEKDIVSLKDKIREINDNLFNKAQ